MEQKHQYTILEKLLFLGGDEKVLSLSTSSGIAVYLSLQNRDRQLVHIESFNGMRTNIATSRSLCSTLILSEAMA
jgi:hypothetical protein